MKKTIKAVQFCLALRKKSRPQECCLLDESLYADFIEIKNPFGAWLADPFIFDNEGETFIFAEKFNLFTGKGHLVWASLSREKLIWRKVRIEKCHLSFPNVFLKNGMIYMMPETSELRCVSLYKSAGFPNDWIKEKTILPQFPGVDTIGVHKDGRNYFYSYLPSRESPVLYCFDENGHSMARFEDGERKLRPAGSSFEVNGALYIPTQDSSRSYGDGICLRKIDSNLSFVSSFTPPAHLPAVSKKTITGCHTYNNTSTYEILDLRFERFSFLRIIGFPIRKIFKTRRK